MNAEAQMKKVEDLVQGFEEIAAMSVEEFQMIAGGQAVTNSI